MSFIKIEPDDFETFTLETNPPRTYVSSSSGSVGNVKLFARRSTVEKDSHPLSAFTDRTYLDFNIDSIISKAKFLSTVGTNPNIFSCIQSYMSATNELPSSLRKQQELEIIRFTPSFNFTSNTERKNIVTNILMPYYRTVYPDAHFAYTNYHSLNFYTASSVPSDSVIMYPNVGFDKQSGGYAGGCYALTGAFTFDFYINPRYANEPDLAYKAGTIYHLSSSYAVSLITGSNKDQNGQASGFRIQLQLSHSVDIQPSLATPGPSLPNDLIFLSDDNALTKNNWHHVTIRWSPQINESSGSIFVDGVSRGSFHVPYSSVGCPALSNPAMQPAVLFIGNYFDGPLGGVGSNIPHSYFFGINPSTREGLTVLNNVGAPFDNDRPNAAFAFNHPLNAEVHDLKIYNRFITDDEMTYFSTNGPPTSHYANTKTGGLVLHVPPLFSHLSPTRVRYPVPPTLSPGLFDEYGGLYVTPFFEEDGTTVDPFNVKLGFGVGGLYHNLENFTMDFAQNTFPRLWNLTGSVVNSTTGPESANDFLYATGSTLKRASTIFPCDNGLFEPNYMALSAISSGSTSKYSNDLGNVDLTLISLRNMISLEDFTRPAISEDSGSLMTAIAGSNPDTNADLRVKPREVLTLLQRLRDSSSNFIVFFDISDMFYGKQIKPGTFELEDDTISGATSPMRLKLRDDGYGNLYRAESDTPQARWNSVGNIFYSEGVVLIKSPHLAFVGANSYKISFSGVQNIHTLTFNVLAKSKQLTSSSNPTYIPGIISAESASDLTGSNGKFVYVTGINLHDENLNVVTKTVLAQPMVKRTGDKIMFRISMVY